MGWIDIRVRRPTKEDGDKFEMVWKLYSSGSSGREYWYTFDRKGCIAWMPIPEFTPMPDPPEGYRFADTATEQFRKDAVVYVERENEWLPTLSRKEWADDMAYAVPIDPPKPKYRPFANADEFDPLRDRWWRYKSYDGQRMPPTEYGTVYHADQCWLRSFENKEFIDGTPFGMPVDDDAG